MKKSEPKYIREIKARMARELAGKMRKRKREEFVNAMAKRKIETYGDMFGLLCGLSKQAKDVAVLWRIECLAGLGYSPAEIVDHMEPKRTAEK